MAADMHSPLEQNRLWRLLRHPDGSDFASAFALEPTAIPEPAEGEVLIRNEYLSLDAGRVTMRFDMTRGLENVPAAYRKLFIGGNIGKVLVALRH